MRICFTDELPAHAHSTGTYCHYEYRTLPNVGWQKLEVKQYIHSHLDEWTSEIQNWHEKVCVQGESLTPYWWFLPASRLIAWQPPIFQPLLFAVALVEMAQKQNLNEVYVIAAPLDVADYIRELLPYAEVVIKKSSVGGKTSVKSAVKEKLRPYKRFLKLSLRAVKNTLLPNINVLGADTILYSHVLSVSNLKSSGDHFFGKAFSSLVEEKKKILFLYNLDSSNDEATRQECVKHFAEQGQSVLFVQDLILPRQIAQMLNIINGLSRFRKTFQERIPALSIAGRVSHRFSKKYYLQMVHEYQPWGELAVYFVAKRLMTAHKFKRLIYPYEEKGLERAIIKARSQVSPSTKLIGFAHAVHNQGHLYLRSKTPKPDLIATTGNGPLHWLKSWAHVDAKRLVLFGSPRFSDPSPKKRDPKARLRVLVLIGQGYEPGNLANYVEEDPSLFKDCEVLLRRYPYGWHDAQKEGIKRLQELGVDLKTDDAPLKQQIHWCDVALFSSTSAGIEAMLNGRIAIYTDLNDIFVLDPVLGRGDLSKIMRCFNKVELGEALKKIDRASNEEYSLLAHEQREFACGVYSPPNVTALLKL